MNKTRGLNKTIPVHFTNFLIAGYSNLLLQIKHFLPLNVPFQPIFIDNFIESTKALLIFQAFILIILYQNYIFLQFHSSASWKEAEDGIILDKKQKRLEYYLGY